MSALEFSLTRFEEESGLSFQLPMVDVLLEGGEHYTQALIDTGAGLSVVNRDWLVSQLGYSEVAIAQGQLMETELADGRVLAGHLHLLTLVLGRERELVLPDVPCVVADSADEVLLGQRGALERLRFFQDGPESTARLDD